MKRYRVKVYTQAITYTWWGKSWSTNINNFSDFPQRLTRGRNYLREGKVHDIEIEGNCVSAVVDGEYCPQYKVSITFKPIPLKSIEYWNKQIETLKTIGEGEVPREYENTFSTKKGGILPKYKDAIMQCECPDNGYTCKHKIALLAALGAIIDREPLILFQLRGVDTDTLLHKAKDNNVHEISVLGKWVKNKKAKEQKQNIYKIRQYDLNGSPLMEFSSYDEAELKTEIPKRIIQRAVSGEKKTGSGYMWRKVKEDEPWENINPLQNNNVARSMPVWQISLEGDLVGVYDSINEASRATGIVANSISRAAKGLQNQAGGYRWMFRDDL